LEKGGTYKELIIKWSDSYINIPKHKNLKHVIFYNYKTRKKNLSGLSELSYLQTIQITESNLTALDGLESLDNLRWLKLAYCPKIVNVFEKKSLLPKSLEWLEIRKCKNLDLSSLPIMPGLRRFDLIDNGKISSLKILLPKMPDIEILDFSETDIDESDFSYLLSLKKLRKISYVHKRSYKYTCEELEELLKNRIMYP
jgi:hypothetical protein